MKIGLALSGGGTKGIAHAGAIQALEEYGITIHSIAGTSAGALVGALYAAGASVKDIQAFFSSSNLFDPRKFAFRRAGFLNSDVFADHIKNYIPTDSFESLEKSLKVTATNLNTMKLKVFDSGELYYPILASAAFPGIFTPVEFENETYVDGGVLNNFPVDLLDDCDIRIGSYVNKVEYLSDRKLKHSYDVANRAFSIGQYDKDLSKFHECDILIEPDKLYDYGLFSFRSLQKMYDIGYDSACRALDESDVLKDLS